VWCLVKLRENFTFTVGESEWKGMLEGQMFKIHPEKWDEVSQFVTFAGT